MTVKLAQYITNDQAAEQFSDNTARNQSAQCIAYNELFSGVNFYASCTICEDNTLCKQHSL